MARKSRKNIPTVVGSATVQTEVRRPFRAGLYARNRRNIRKRDDRNPGGIDEKLCSRYGRYFGCGSL